MQRELQNGDYRPGAYRTFPMLEPKPRLILAAPQYTPDEGAFLLTDHLSPCHPFALLRAGSEPRSSGRRACPQCDEGTPVVRFSRRMTRTVRRRGPSSRRRASRNSFILPEKTADRRGGGVSGDPRGCREAWTWHGHLTRCGTGGTPWRAPTTRERGAASPCARRAFGVRPRSCRFFGPKCRPKAATVASAVQ